MPARAEAYFATQQITRAKWVWLLTEVPAYIRSGLGFVARNMGLILERTHERSVEAIYIRNPT